MNYYFMIDMQNIGPNHLVLAMARIIGSWQCCRLLVGNIANGIASKSFFAFLTELGNFKQKFFGGNAIGNVAKQKSAALPRADDSGQCMHSTTIKNFLYLLRKHPTI